MYPPTPQAYSNPPPPYEPSGTGFPPGASGPAMAMTPQTDVKLY